MSNFNFGFSLAQRVQPYLTELRTSKAAFKLENVLGFVKDCAASSVGKDSKEGPESFEAAAVFFGKVVEELKLDFLRNDRYSLGCGARDVLHSLGHQWRLTKIFSNCANV